MKNIKTVEELRTRFDVIGAGQIELGNSPFCRCGGEIGFHFGVSWGKYGFTGGVLAKEEAKKLADFIYAQLEKNKGDF